MSRKTVDDDAAQADDAARPGPVAVGAAESGDEGARDDDADDDAHDPEEDALQLDDLDRLGVDGAMSQLRGGDDEPVELERPHRRPRSPVLSAIVLAFSTYLLITMWADFRYWMQDAAPTDLGHAAEFVQDGQVPPGFHDAYVVLEGTPDVQHAARMTTNKGYIGYLRISEGGGQLFAAVPRGKEEKVANTFEGRYQGRMLRLGSGRGYPWLEQFFDAEGVTRSIDTTAQQLIEALQSAGDTITVDTAEGPVALGPKDRVRLVAARPEARVQLGVSTFRRAEDAEARLEALGYPYAKPEGVTPKTFHSFVVRIPAAEREAARARLLEGTDAPAASSDPKVGAAVLPMTSTFTVPAAQLQLDRGSLSFPYGDNTTTAGYDVRDGELVERKLGEDDFMSLTADELSAVRLEMPIELDPNGYLIVVGADPSTARTSGILWLVVFGIALVNVASLLLWWRRRHR